MHSINSEPRFETPFRYLIPSGYDSGMRVPAMLFGNARTVESAWKDGSAKQAINVSTLPSILKASIAMPDIHGGYGFPIGGVAAFDYEEGIISPGGVGYDINCGVSLFTVPLTYSKFAERRKEVIDEIFNRVPSGLGNKSSEPVSMNEMAQIMNEGLNWAVNNGLALSEDRERTEDGGAMKGENTSGVSNAAKQRGKNQVGTLGAGNHFLEVQRVEKIFDHAIAKKFGLYEEDQITFMIHTGSRGLGHQVATDHLKEISGKFSGPPLRDTQLMYAEIHSRQGSSYLGAMAAAANFGFVNRAVIGWRVRQAFRKVFGIEESDIKLVYSLAHNIAKPEEHEIEGKRTKVMVHRKGATRAFPAGKAEGIFASTGHPVIVPGDMGSRSYLLVGDTENMNLSFGSSCHGAGRLLSRHGSLNTFKESEVMEKLKNEGVYARFSTKKVMLEEAPGSYKNIDEVIGITTGAQLARSVAMMKPVGVVKG